MGRIRASLALVAWTGLLLAGLTGLHHLGATFPLESLVGSDFEVALGASLRLAGLAAGYWLLLSTTAYLLTAAAQIPAGLRALEWATLPVIRRLADQVAARSLIVALATSLPVGNLVDPGYVPVPAGDPPPSPTTTAPASSTTTHPPEVNAPPPTIPQSPPPAPKAPPLPTEPPRAGPIPQDTEVVVRPGDHMWGLAETRLAVHLGRPPTNREIVPYWARVVDINRNRIRSGDPDLIFPGEVLLLPIP